MNGGSSDSLKVSVAQCLRPNAFPMGVTVGWLIPVGLAISLVRPMRRAAGLIGKGLHDEPLDHVVAIRCEARPDATRAGRRAGRVGTALPPPIWCKERPRIQPLVLIAAE
jgi:hypothetical protein